MKGQSAEAAAERILASWDLMTEHRYRVTKRTGPFYRLPVVKSKWKVIEKEMASGLRVLDIGAGKCPFKARLEGSFPGLRYESMDVDRSQPHDYYDLDSIRGPYDRILLLDVIEHLPLDGGVRMLARAHGLLNPGGRLVVAVPNTFSPSTCLWDVTHRTNYSFAEVGGVLLALGFEMPRLYRVHRARLRRRIARMLLHPILKVLLIDPARHIMAVAEKPAGGSDGALDEAGGESPSKP